VWGHIDGDGGDKGKNKGTEVDKNIFNNQQGLEAAMEDRGGGCRWGAIMTNDNQWQQRGQLQQQQGWQATKRAMATAMKVVGNKECNDRAARAMAMATRVSGEGWQWR
jgi:hypothetical protein